MRRSPTGVAARAGLVLLTVLLAGGVAGCSEESPEETRSAYCEVVEQQRQQLTDALGQGQSTGLISALPILERLRDAAPRDIADDWATVVRRITVLRDALADADVDPATYDPEDPPDGIDADQLAAIRAAADGLLTDATRAAFADVQQQARDVCGTPLTLG